MVELKKRWKGMKKGTLQKDLRAVIAAIGAATAKKSSKDI